MALPKDPSVIAGDVTIQNHQSHMMVIKASDRAIIDYKSFDIQKGERVQFVQPSSSSSVLNRVHLRKGEKASKILGQLESNGKIVLVNPNGIYFGPHASVRVGSLIASALEIANDDFIKGQYSFLLKNKDYLAEIRNDGLLTASPEGSIVLMAPIIRNLGTIEARAGKVVLASGEHVTLDFHGDSLLQFSVEGDLKGAVIQHLGLIHAEGGEVSMRLPTAKRAIHEIINHKGLEKGEVFVKENGEIFLVSASSILAKKVSLEASALFIDGNINVSSQFGKGGEVSLSGAEINLLGSRIDASGWTGGGDVLIGGEYQGSGSMPYAMKVAMDETSNIISNAVDSGDGGNVVLWSVEKTQFEGNIFAQGGFQSGNGGCVETSSIEDLSCLNGYVNTSANAGIMGQWLLDPTLLVITSGVSANPLNCSSGTVGVGSFTSSPTSVVLCANVINQLVPINMTVPGSGLTFKAPFGEVGVLILSGGDITTERGTISVQNLEISLANSMTFDTTTGPTGAVGAIIGLGKVNAATSGSGNSLTVNAGTSVFEAADIGDVTPIGAFIVDAGLAIVQNIITESASINIRAPLILKEDAIFSTELGGGSSIALRVVDAMNSGNQSIVIRAGTGALSIGVVGSSTPLKNFSILSAAPLLSISNIITQGGVVFIRPSIVLRNPITLIQTYSDLNPTLVGNVILGDVLTEVPSFGSLSIKTGLKGFITLGDLGTREAPLLDLSMNLNQALNVGEIFAKSLDIAAYSGIANFSGNISLYGNLNVKAAKIFLGGDIIAADVNFVSLNSILNKGSASQSITARFPGVILLNALRGQIGAKNSPLELDARANIILGGNPIYTDLIGITQTAKYISGNKPCLTKFRGKVLPCLAARSIIFDALPKSAFRLFFMNPINLGIGYPAAEYSNIQYSPFGKITAISANLPDVAVL